MECVYYIIFGKKYINTGNHAIMPDTVYNEKIRPFIKEQRSVWLPAAEEIIALWPRFTNESHYTNGYWVENSHELLGVLVIMEGDAYLTCDGKRYLISRNDAAIIPFGYRKLATGPSGYCFKRAIGLQGLALKVIMKAFHFDSLYIIRSFDRTKFNVLFDRLSLLLRARDPESIAEISLLSYSLLLDLNTLQGHISMPDPLMAARRFMEQHLSRKITIDELSTASGCSAKTLEALFRKYTSFTPLAFLKKLRIDYAKILLENEDIRVKEAARMCGYANQLYFSNDFRIRVGVSPKIFRERSLRHNLKAGASSCGDGEPETTGKVI